MAVVYMYGSLKANCIAHFQSGMLLYLYHLTAQYLRIPCNLFFLCWKFSSGGVSYPSLLRIDSGMPLALFTPLVLPPFPLPFFLDGSGISIKSLASGDSVPNCASSSDIL